MKWELLPAIYGVEGYECSQVEDPIRYSKLAAKIDSGKSTIYCRGYVLGVVRDFNGRPVVCHSLCGGEVALRHFHQLQVDLAEKVATVKALDRRLLVETEGRIRALRIKVHK